MAEISKLSIGHALDKLRGSDAPSSKMTQLDSKIDALDEEMRRLKATSRRVERDQRAASIKPGAQKAVPRHLTKLGIFGIVTAVVIVILMLAWKWLL